MVAAGTGWKTASDRELRQRADICGFWGGTDPTDLRSLLQVAETAIVSTLAVSRLIVLILDCLGTRRIW